MHIIYNHVFQLPRNAKKSTFISQILNASKAPYEYIQVYNCYFHKKLLAHNKTWAIVFKLAVN